MGFDLNAGYAGKRVFVTGHTGFKGAWLTGWLLELGAEVFGYSLPKPVSVPDLFNNLGLSDHCQDIRGDIRDRNALDRALADAEPEIVFHLAGQPLVRFGYMQPLATFETNALGTANILAAIRECSSVRAVVVATSDKVYRNTDEQQMYTENAALGGDDPYSASKVAAEMAVSAFRSVSGLPVTITVRAGNVIGGGDWGRDRLIPDLVRAFTAGKAAKIRNPTMTRPWQHVLDCLHGYLLVGGAIMEDRDQLAASYNIGPDSGKPICVRDIANLCIAAWGQGRWVEIRQLDNHAPAESPYLALDCSAVRRDIGWWPRYNCETAVAKTIEWYKADYKDMDSKDLLYRQLVDFMACTEN